MARACSALICVILTVSCAGQKPKTSKEPQPVFADTTTSQAEFRQLSAEWHAALTPRQRAKLEVPLRKFLVTHPEDDQRRMARVLLAWILIQKGQLVEAGRLVEETLRGPKGVAHDFATVCEAALMTQHGRPQSAIKQLRKLQGKIIDPVERFLATEQLVTAALAANLYSESLLYMIDWAEQAAPYQRSRVRASIDSNLRRMPRRVLERALTTLEPNPDRTYQQANAQRYAQEQWLYDRITQRLAELAVENQDEGLAKRVMEKRPQLSEQGGEELVRLATGGTLPASVHGRTFGLVLSTGSDLQRRRSGELATGVSVALSTSKKKGDTIEFISAEATKAHGAIAQAMEDLAAQGASLIIAGIDADTANAAARQAERMGTPVLLLHPHTQANHKFAFTLGVSQHHELDLIGQQLKLDNANNSLVLNEDSPQCHGELYATARPSFPIRQWKREKLSAIILLEMHSCAEALLQVAKHQRFNPLYALGLDAASSIEKFSTQSVIALSAGSYPFDPDDPIIASWMARVGRSPTWHETLGRDAALIAQAALQALPATNISTEEEVKRFHRHVRLQLLQAPKLPLWSTRSMFFDNEQRLQRQLRFIGQQR